MWIFVFFWKFVRSIFCFQKAKYTFKPHNTIYQVKGMHSNFSKILKFFEVGQLHALEGFLTERNRKNAKYMIRTNGQKPAPRGVMRKSFFTFSFTLINILKRGALYFLIYYFDEEKIDLFFGKFGHFAYFCPKSNFYP